MRALFIGRFQPFHVGHLSSIMRIKKDGFDEIVIGVGSSQESNTDKNPFTAEERREMLETVLVKHSGLKYRIIFIPDINNNPKWVGHVESTLKENGVEGVDAVYTNNPVVKELFEAAQYKVVEPELVRDGDDIIMATKIREMIAKNDACWKMLVPKEVYEKLVKFGGIKRIKRIYSGLEIKK